MKEGESDTTPLLLTYARATHTMPLEPERKITLWKDLIRAVTQVTSHASLKRVSEALNEWEEYQRQRTQDATSSSGSEEPPIAYEAAKLFFTTVFGKAEVQLYQQWMVNLHALQVMTSKYWNDEEHGHTLTSIQRTIQFTMQQLDHNTESESQTTQRSAHGSSVVPDGCQSTGSRDPLSEETRKNGECHSKAQTCQLPTNLAREVLLEPLHVKEEITKRTTDCPSPGRTPHQ